MEWQPGDILACHGTDLVARIIRHGTRKPFDPWSCWSPPSHVGMIVPWAARQQHVLVESTTLCPHQCLYRQENVSGSQIQHARQRIADYTNTGGRVDVYRLVGINGLTPKETVHLSYWLIDYMVIHHHAGYDTRGALISGLKLCGLLNKIPDADLDSLFCSEMLAAVLMRLGLLNHGNPTWYNPGRLIRELVRTGKYEKVQTFTDRNPACDVEAAVAPIAGRIEPASVRKAA